MEVCEVPNNLSLNTLGKALEKTSVKISGKTLNIKSINTVDFKKLISNLLCNKKDNEENTDTNSGENLMDMLISQLTAANFTYVPAENEIPMDRPDIVNFIKNMYPAETETLTYFQEGSNKNITEFINALPVIKSDSSEKNTCISAEEFKSKLTELVMKLEDSDKNQVKVADNMENLGDFKKYFLISNKNNVQANNFQIKNTENKSEYMKTVIEKIAPDLKLDKKESEAETKNTGTKDTRIKNTGIKYTGTKDTGIKDTETKNTETKDTESKKTEAENSLNITDKTFNNVINKIQIKNSAFTDNNSLNEVRADNFSRDVIKTVSYMKENDVKSLTVKVLPKELGQITIEITYSGDKVSAKLTPSSNSTFQLLDQNMVNLNSELSKNGVNLQNISLNLYSGNFSDRGNSRGQEYKRKDSRKQVMEISPNEKTEETGNINIFA